MKDVDDKKYSFQTNNAHCSCQYTQEFCLDLSVLRYSIPYALLYHSKYVFQILWNNQSSDILFKVSWNDNLISKLYPWGSVKLYWDIARGDLCQIVYIWWKWPVWIINISMLSNNYTGDTYWPHNIQFSCMYGDISAKSRYLAHG